ncbi:MAG: hypothetical protein J6S71_01460 [Clostridia bacterium]|nr:hypothetical protein [Clostridia bacterium]
MRTVIKYASIAMIVLSAWELFFDISTLVRAGFIAHYVFTLPFINHVGMLVIGILGIKLGGDDEKQKMLAGISGMQMILCLLAVFVGHSLWVTIKTIGIVDILSIAISATLLVYYIKGAVRVKKEQQVR